MLIDLLVNNIEIVLLLLLELFLALLVNFPSVLTSIHFPWHRIVVELRKTNTMIV